MTISYRLRGRSGVEYWERGRNRLHSFFFLFFGVLMERGLYLGGEEAFPLFWLARSWFFFLIFSVVLFPSSVNYKIYHRRMKYTGKAFFSVHPRSN